MSSETEAGAVPYEEPGIVTILIQSSFIFALNSIDYILDKVIYCGLIGQILVGMAFGTPGADILGASFQRAITDLGYLGLILIIFEGGLSTDMKALRSNFLLSLVVALTGITLPIALSFLLVKISNATILQSFAAGCALSSTSLGTTFTILKSSGLDNSRLGVVLTSAAMFDDVVGLVLVQVISNLGASNNEGFSAVTVIRPVFVSIGYATLVPLLLYLFNRIGPLVYKIASPGHSEVIAMLLSRQARLVYSTALLAAAVASASYAGTSNLFAAYLAGLLISSIDENRRDWSRFDGSQKNVPMSSIPPEIRKARISAANEDNSESWEMVAAAGIPIQNEEISLITSSPQLPDHQTQIPGSTEPKVSLVHPSTQMSISSSLCNTDPTPNIYEIYYATIVNRLLKAFFFSSIGFSIPITRLFSPPTLWRGLVYSLLMIMGKFTCGLWLVRFSLSSSAAPVVKSSTTSTPKSPTAIFAILLQYRPQSLYPAAMLGSAMVARGEIGFLISAIAQANGIFNVRSGNGEKGDLFLIVTWAVLICTLVGPVTVGLLVRRVKRLRERRAVGGARADPLGVWRDI